jgi:DNA modification methylase
LTNLCHRSAFHVAVAKAPSVAIARKGDVFELGSHVIVCGDATEPDTVATVMSGTKACLVLTDQPYNVKIAGHVTGQDCREFVMASGELSEVEFAKFNAAWIAASIAHLCDGGVLGTFIDWRGYGSVATAAAGLNLIPLNLIVWAKTNAGMGSLYRSQHVLCPLFKQGKTAHINNVELGRHGRWRSNVWRYPGASSVGSDARKGLTFHPTVKPVAMLEDALLDLTNKNEIVLDPFLGSGSMLVAAEKAGRHCRGIELDPLYVDVALKRYQEITGAEVRLRETGENFEELRIRRSSKLFGDPLCADCNSAASASRSELFSLQKRA